VHLPKARPPAPGVAGGNDLSIEDGDILATNDNETQYHGRPALATL